MKYLLFSDYISSGSLRSGRARLRDNRSRKDHSAENINIIRHIALNLLKQEKTLKLGIKSKDKTVVGMNHIY